MADPTARPTRTQGHPAWLRFALLVCGLLGAATAIGSELRETPIVKAVQRVAGAVVNIRGEKTVAAPPDRRHAGAEAGRRVNGMGTGVVIDPRGYIITNYHVVDGVREIQVTLADGQRHVAKLVARDRKPTWPSSRSTCRSRCRSCRSAPPPT